MCMPMFHGRWFQRHFKIQWDLTVSNPQSAPPQQSAAGNLRCPPPRAPRPPCASMRGSPRFSARRPSWRSSRRGEDRSSGSGAREGRLTISRFTMQGTPPSLPCSVAQDDFSLDADNNDAGSGEAPPQPVPLRGADPCRAAASAARVMPPLPPPPLAAAANQLPTPSSAAQALEGGTC